MLPITSADRMSPKRESRATAAGWERVKGMGQGILNKFNLTTAEASLHGASTRSTSGNFSSSYWGMVALLRTGAAPDATVRKVPTPPTGWPFCMIWK